MCSLKNGTLGSVYTVNLRVGRVILYLVSRASSSAKSSRLSVRGGPLMGLYCYWHLWLVFDQQDNLLRRAVVKIVRAQLVELLE